MGSAERAELPSSVVRDMPGHLGMAGLSRQASVSVSPGELWDVRAFGGMFPAFPQVNSLITAVFARMFD
jgi:hypothetical protein